MERAKKGLAFVLLLAVFLQAAVPLPLWVPAAEPPDISIEGDIFIEDDISIEDLSDGTGVPEIFSSERAVGDWPGEDLPIEEISLEELATGEAFVGDPFMDGFSIEELSTGEAFVGDPFMDGFSIEELSLEELPPEELSLAELSLEELSPEGASGEELSDGEDELSGGVPSVQNALADIPYINEEGKADSCHMCTVVEEALFQWNEGWYVVSEDVTVSERIRISKDVRLILADGATLTALKGIEVNGSSTNSLRIYAQQSGTGAIVATGNTEKKETGDAGIGGSSGMPCGPISIYGGNITATGGTYGAGIGGGNYSDTTSILIAGGTVNAKGGQGASGIGGGYRGGCQAVSISGGTVTAAPGKTSGKTPAQAIGMGQGSKAGPGMLSFQGYDGLEIHAGADENSALIYTGNAEGIQACRDSLYVHIKPAENGIRYIDKDKNEWILSNDLYERMTDGQDTWTHNWYYVAGTLTISSRVKVSGHVSVILADGAHLTAEKGISVPEGSTLTLFGQKNQKGQLTADARTLPQHAGIGGEAASAESFVHAGTVEIYGGNIQAFGGNGGAGIGAGSGGSGTVSIGWGTVTAAGGNGGAGIGGGTVAGDTGTASVIITGGTVTATGGENASGIGGSSGRDGGLIRIDGGEAAASGSGGASGIGGGNGGSSGTVVIGSADAPSGAAVTAVGGSEGPGIGSGNGGTGGAVTIEKGSVTASGGYAGIGNNSDAVTINGGTVLAFGRDGRPAIGEGAALILGNVRAFSGENESGLLPVTVSAGNDARMAACRMPCAKTEECPSHVAETSAWEQNDNGHWHVCAYCMAYIDLALHRYGEEYQPLSEDDPDYDAYHQHACVTCGHTELKPHEYDIGELNCVLCGGGPVSVTYSSPDGKLLQHMGANRVLDSSVEWNDDVHDGWYALRGNVTIESRITVYGNVNLVLFDGASLTARRGIYVEGWSSLTIWGQVEGSGQLIATGKGRDAGIGGNSLDDASSCGVITKNGGHIVSSGGFGAAGIGTGNCYDDSDDEYEDQIYSIDPLAGPRQITIAGGLVEAAGGKGAAGIGGGRNSTGGHITITGGTIKADGEESGAGIGGGENAPGGTIEISGGVIDAQSSLTVLGRMRGYGSGAGIGSGRNPQIWFNGNTKYSTNITISGSAKVTAISNMGAGIGCGELIYFPDWISSKDLLADVNIISGNIIAESKTAMGIGVGHSGDVYSITEGILSHVPNINLSLYLRNYLDSLTIRSSEQAHATADIYLHEMYRDHDDPSSYFAPGSRSIKDIENRTIIRYEACFITFDPGDGGTGYMPPQTASRWGKYTIPECQFQAPRGKYFTGWRLPDGTRVIEGRQYSVDNRTSLTLVAQWAKGYNVWLGDKLISPYNTPYISSRPEITYNAETQTLNMQYVYGISGCTEIPGTDDGTGKPQTALIYAEGVDLILNISDCSIVNSSLEADYGIYVRNGSLTIESFFFSKGTDNLTVEGKVCGIYADGDISISESRNLDVRALSENGTGIHAGGSILLTGISSKHGGWSFNRYNVQGGLYALDAAGDISISNAVMKAEALSPGGNAIHANGNVSILKPYNSYIDIAPPDVKAFGDAVGIAAGENVLICDTIASVSGSSYGIYAEGNLDIRRTDSYASVTAESAGTAICSGNAINLQDAYVRASGGFTGIRSSGGMTLTWADHEFNNFLIDASGGNAAISSAISLDTGLTLRAPEDGAITPNQNAVLNPDGTEAKAAQIGPRLYEVSFSPGWGDSTMESLLIPAYSACRLPDCIFDPPSEDSSFGGWKIGETIYPANGSFTPTEDTTAVAQWGYNWAHLQKLLSRGGTITLPCDVTAAYSNTYLSVATDVTLDLNGHTISRNLTERTSSGYVLRLTKGSLTIRDSAGGGKITGGCNNGSCGAILVSGGTLNLESGCITGNSCHVSEKSTFAYGGAVRVAGGTFNMTGGEISGNTAETAGSAVVLAADKAVFHMSGGIITGNDSADGCAVYVIRGRFEISGSPKVIGNTRQGGTLPANYDTHYHGAYGETYKHIYVTGPLSEDALIGVRASIKDDKYRQVTNGLSGKGALSNFVSDDEDYVLGLTSAGEVELLKKPSQPDPGANGDETQGGSGSSQSPYSGGGSSSGSGSYSGGGSSSGSGSYSGDGSSSGASSSGSSSSGSLAAAATGATGDGESTESATDQSQEVTLTKALSPVTDISSTADTIETATKARSEEKDWKEAGEIFVLELPIPLSKEVWLTQDKLSAYRLWNNAATLLDVYMLPNAAGLVVGASKSVRYVSEVLSGNLLGNDEDYDIDIFTALTKEAFEKPVIPVGRTGKLDFDSGKLTLPAYSDMELCLHEISARWLMEEITEGVICPFLSNQDKINAYALGETDTLPAGKAESRIILGKHAAKKASDDVKFYWIGQTPETAEDPEAILIGLKVNEKTDEVDAFRTSAKAFADDQEMTDLSLYLYRDSRSDRREKVLYNLLFFETPEDSKSLIKVYNDIPDERDMVLPKALDIVLRPFDLGDADLPAYSISGRFFAMNDGTDGEVSMFDGLYTAAVGRDSFSSDYLHINGLSSGNIQAGIKKGQNIWPEWTGKTTAGDIAGGTYRLVNGKWKRS